MASFAARIAAHPFKKKVWDKLATRRDQLDKARTFAKELIYDEVKYFYPFKPPAVSAEKA